MRGDQADVRQGADVSWGQIDERRLDDRAILAVEAASAVVWSRRGV